MMTSVYVQPIYQLYPRPLPGNTSAEEGIGYMTWPWLTGNLTWLRYAGSTRFPLTGYGDYCQSLVGA